MSGRTTTLRTENEFPRGESWLQKQAVKNSENNAKQKRIALEQFDQFLQEQSLTVRSVDNTILEDFSLWLDHSEDLAHSTLSHRWYAVRTYLNDIIDDQLGHLDGDDYILSWLDGGTETNKQQDRDIHYIPQESIQELIQGAKNLKNKLVIQLLWNTGCRPSEVSRMKLRRLDRDNRRIKIQTSKVKDTDAPNYERNVFYSRSMRSSMREWLDLGGRDSYPHAADSPYLIVGYNTPSISARQINKIVRQAAERAGIQEDMVIRSDGVTNNRVTPKTLRHSFAVHSVRGREVSGTPPIDIERLRRLMGHSSLDITRHYLQYRESEIRDAYDRSHPA